MTRWMLGLVLIVVLSGAAWAGSPEAAPGIGSLVDGGVEMKIVFAIAVLDPEESEVSFTLLPFEPTADELKYLQAGKPFFFADKPRTSPDEATWPGRVPYGTVSLSWRSAKASMGDAVKAFVHVYGSKIGPASADVNVNFPGSAGGVTLTGALEGGKDVELVMKGEDKEKKLSWNVRARSKVFVKGPAPS